MKLKNKFRLESPSGKVEPYSSSVSDNVNKKGKEEMRKERRNVMLSEKIYILELGKT